VITYAMLFLLGAITILTLRRLLIMALRWIFLVICVVVAVRLTIMTDERLAQPEWFTGALIGGIVAFVVVGLLLSTVIYNAFVNARRAGAHERIDKEHDGLLR